MSERLTDDQLKARGLVLAEMTQQEATIAALRTRVAELEGELRLARMHPYGAALKDAPKDMTDISHRFPDGVPETDRPLGDRERRELNAYRKMFRAAAKELRIVADALESPLDIEVPTLDQTPISDLPLNITYAVRVINGLKNGGVSTIGELMMLTDRELMLMPNMGRGSLNAIKQALAERGQYIPR